MSVPTGRSTSPAQTHESAAQASGPASAKLDASERARGLLERVLAGDPRNADAAGALAAVSWHLAGGRGDADAARAVGLTQLTLFHREGLGLGAFYASVGYREVGRWEATLRVGDEWRDAWKEYFQITPIGERLLLRPSWRDVPEDAGERVVLTIDPGGAFGSGLHESTRLVLRAIEADVKGGETVLDVGCGSGILAIAALLLGAERAIGIDVEDSAVPTTIENAEINGVDDRLEASTDPIESVAGTYALVLANIQAPILIGMAPTLAERVAAGGTLVLSGILAGQEDEVAAAFTALPRGLEATVTADGEWRAITLR